MYFWLFIEFFVLKRSMRPRAMLSRDRLDWFTDWLDQNWNCRYFGETVTWRITNHA